MFLFLITRQPPRSTRTDTRFPYTALFRSQSIPPFVWLANPYQNNGGTSLSDRSFDSTTAPFSADPYNQNIPAGGRPSYQIDSIDPDFKLPTVYKFSLGYDTELPWMGLIGTVDYQMIKAKDAVFYQ